MSMYYCANIVDVTYHGRAFGRSWGGICPVAPKVVVVVIIVVVFPVVRRSL